MKDLEKRMYFFVPYNISPIQQAIQAGHSALEYARKYTDDYEFQDFADKWKTWIILNGGTTNSKGKEGANFREDIEPYIGTLDNIVQQIIMNEVKYSIFTEPDLNDALTAVCFICDERVFNYDDYPNFIDWLLNVKMYPTARDAAPPENIMMLKSLSNELLQHQFPEYYVEWVNFVGGEKNIFLRELLKGKKLA